MGSRAAVAAWFACSALTAQVPLPTAAEHVLELQARDPLVVRRALRALGLCGEGPLHTDLLDPLGDALEAADPTVAAEFVVWVQELAPERRAHWRDRLWDRAKHWPAATQRRWLAALGTVPSGTENVFEARLLDHRRPLALTPDLAIEALAQLIAEFAFELNEPRRRVVLAAVLVPTFAAAVAEQRQSLARIDGERLRAELQWRLGGGFLDVLGPEPSASLLQLDLAVARLAGVPLALDDPELVACSRCGVALWGAASGPLLQGAGYSPLPPWPGTFEEVAVAYVHSLPARPEGIAPRLLRCLVDLDGGDSARAIAVLRAWHHWPEPALRETAGSWPLMGEDPDRVERTLAVVGDAATWTALRDLARELADARRRAGTRVHFGLTQGDACTVTANAITQAAEAVTRGERWWDNRAAGKVSALWLPRWQLTEVVDAQGSCLFAPAAAEELLVDGHAATAFRLRAARPAARGSEAR